MTQAKKYFRFGATLLLVIALSALLVIAISVLIIYLKWSDIPSPMEEISAAVGIEFPASAQILSGSDDHGAFQGDGRAWYEVDTAGTAFDPLPTDWKPLPLSGDAESAFYGSSAIVGDIKRTILPALPKGAKLPEVKNGFWFFDDHCGDECSAFDESRLSLSFTAALYDADTETLYYLDVDSNDKRINQQFVTDHS